MSDNFKEIETKLKELGIRARTSEGKTTDAEKIENEYGIIFPDDFKKFLIGYGDITADKEICYKPIVNNPILPEDGYATFVGFHTLQDNTNGIKNNIECYWGRMPSNLIPIAESHGGDQICIGIKGKECGKVYLWLHEEELEAYRMINPDKKYPDIDDYWDNVYLLANSFYEFIMSFITRKEEACKSFKIVSERISDDFLKLIEEHRKKNNLK